MTEETIQAQAIAYVKEHKREILLSCCNTTDFPPVTKPFTLFMAGSPGSGKTEFSKAFIKSLQVKDPCQKIVRLDVDEIRDQIPLYNGANSDAVQRACSIMFDKINDHIIDHRQNALIDGTFSSPKTMENVQRALDHGRRVGVIYLYQDPFLAWEYTQKREKLEGRTVPKDYFIRAYFEARRNVNAVKLQFGDKVSLDLFEKDEHNNYEKRAEFNIPSLDNYIKEKYTDKYLAENLPDHI